MPRHDFLKLFPFKTIRDEQKKAIEFALDSFESGKRYCLMECGTGVGKSAIAVCVARYLELYGDKTVDDDGNILSGSYILTTQKVLQQQYVDDFGPGVGESKNLLLSIKSASNYSCGFYPDQSCGESRRILSQLQKQLSGTDFQKHCKCNCLYAKDKAAFIESPISVTNFPYFFAETMYGKKLTPRATLIIDECHNTESALGSVIEIIFSERFAKDIIKCKLPTKSSQDEIFTWIKDVYKPKLAKHIKSVEKLLSKKYETDAKGFGETSKQYETLDKHICKVNRFIEFYDPSNWIMNVSSNVIRGKTLKKYEFKTIDVSKFSYDLLFKFSGRTLMLSATVVDKDVFCESIGLDPKDVAFISIPSPFSPQNRPIHFINAGSMSMSNIDKTLPNMVIAIKMLLEQHSDCKGIIHATNYKIAKYISENLKSERIISHTPENREQMLRKHLESEQNTVLLSPSMMEGVDLADDASRFQILCKVPFPYLGDEVVKKRMSKNKDWYTYQTVKSIVQSLGRSVRNESDFATSYILDGDWERFFKMNSRMFQKEFIAAIK